MLLIPKNHCQSRAAFQSREELQNLSFKHPLVSAQLSDEADGMAAASFARQKELTLFWVCVSSFFAQFPLAPWNMPLNGSISSKTSQSESVLQS